MIRSRPFRRALGAALVVAGGVMMGLVGDLRTGALLMFAGVALEIAGIALEHRDGSREG